MHPLHQRVRSVTSQACRLVQVRALAWAIFACLAAFIVLGGTDAWFRSRDPVVRWGGWLCLVGTAIWSYGRWLRPATRYRLTDIEAAQEIELRIPSLRAKLASAVEFLAEPSANNPFESQALRQHSIETATDATRRIDLGTCLDRRPTHRAVLFAAGVAVVLGAFALVRPQHVLCAAQRLAFPWRQVRYPNAHALEFVDLPARLTAGDDLEVAVRDRLGRLPRSVTLFVQFQPSGQTVQHTLKRVGDQMVGQIPNVRESLRVRAEGEDDDSMPWCSVSVRPAPLVHSYTLSLHPPEYSGVTNGGLTANAVLAGTRAEVHGDVDRPLTAARIQTDTSSHSPIDLAVTSAGLRFESLATDAWIVERSGSFHWMLEDEDGFVGGKSVTHELNVLPDEVPEVQWESAGGTQSVSPNAVLPLRANVQDDLAIRDVQLKIHPGSGSEPDSKRSSTKELFRRTQPPILDQFPRADGGDRQTIRDQIDLRSFSEPRPGDTWELKLIVTDFLGQVGESAALRIRIVSPDMLAEQLAQKRTSLLTILTESQRVQTDARRRTDESLRQASAAHDQEARELLRVARHAQQRVLELLAGESDGALARVLGMMQELKNNRIERDSNSVQLADLAAELTELRDQELTRVEAAFQAAGQAGSDIADGETGPLATAMRHQDRVLASLDGMLAKLSDWESLHRLASEAKRIERTQEQIADATNRLMQTDRSFRRVNELTDAERAERSQWARRQFDAGHDLERLTQRLRESLPRQAERDAAAGQAVEGALQVIDESGLNSQIRGSAENLERNRLGEAQTAQAEIRDALRNLSAALSQQPEQNLERAVGSMRRSADNLKQFARQEQDLADAFRGAIAEPDPGRRQEVTKDTGGRQRDLADAAEREAGQLRRLPAAAATEKLRSATAAARQAADAASAGNPESAAERAGEAAQSLADAAQALENEMRSAQTQLDEQRLMRLAQNVLEWIETQQEFTALAEWNATHEVRKSPQGSTGESLAELQLRLGHDVATESQQRFAERSFALVLRETADCMQRAGEQLTLEDFQRALPPQQQALRCLNLLREALRGDEPMASEDPSNPPDEPGSSSQPQEAPGRNLVAELRLLRAWQIEIQDRSEELWRERKRGPLQPEQVRELRELGERQGEIAALAAELNASVLSAAEESENKKRS